MWLLFLQTEVDKMAPHMTSEHLEGHLGHAGHSEDLGHSKDLASIHYWNKFMMQ